VELLLALMIGRSKVQLQTNQVSRLISRLPKWNDMPFHEESFFQQDGAPSHYANVVKDYLNETFRPRWIGRGVTKENAISWPARSPDWTL
jgi:hypothetical protein